MPAVASVTPIWKKQKVFVVIFTLAAGLWFFVDGKWIWPRSNERWKEHHRLTKEKRIDEWPAIAKSKGWSDKPPHKYYEQDDILVQFLIATAAGLISAITLFYWLKQKNRVVKTDEEAVYAPTGTRIPFSAITGLGLKKWESKGFATVRYELDGKKGEFVLDDYKFDRDATHQIKEEIESHLRSRGASESAS